MSNEHPITPPPELTARWLCSEDYISDVPTNSTMTITSSRLQNVATQAARWGADQKLEACIERLDINGCPDKWIDLLRAACRPKPPSPKEQALEALKRAKPLGSFDGCMMYGSIRDFELVLQAVQSLPDNETN